MMDIRMAITGGTSGLGLALVREWTKAGARVAFGAPGHMSRIGKGEMGEAGVHFLALAPGDMDTPMHALALPDADRASLRRPEAAAREMADAIEAALPHRDLRVQAGVALLRGIA